MFAYIDKTTNNVVGTGDLEVDDAQVYSISTTIPVEELLDYSYLNNEFILNMSIVNKRNAIQAKNLKVEKVSQLKVTVTSGKVFDGDETSQDRMVRAINIASISGQIQTQWKLADNTIVMVTLDELKEALALAGQEMSRIWL